MPCEKSYNANVSKENISVSKWIKIKWLYSPFRQRNVQTCSAWLFQKIFSRRMELFYASLSVCGVQMYVHYFILCLGKGLSGFVAARRFVLLCSKAPGMRSAFASTDPSMFTPVDHKPTKIWKGGIITSWPMWFLAEHSLFSLGDVMGICKIRSAVIHCFDSFHWPFLFSVILCVGRRCGLFPFSYNIASLLALARCHVEMLV